MSGQNLSKFQNNEPFKTNYLNFKRYILFDFEATQNKVNTHIEKSLIKLLTNKEKQNITYNAGLLNYK